jgi:general secretion pathway protein A
LVGQGPARDAAWTKLFEVWALQPPAAGQEPCAAAEAQGLRCLATHGTWLQLRGLNLPAVLEFALPNGEKRHATLLRLHGDQAEFAVAGGSDRFDPADFLPYWRGDALLLWKPPPGGATALAAGTVSEAVAWVRQRLPAPAAPEALQSFDKGLREKVLAFQKAHGLAADGVVGAQTMILLGMRADDSGIPRLVPINP